MCGCPQCSTHGSKHSTTGWCNTGTQYVFGSDIQLGLGYGALADSSAAVSWHCTQSPIAALIAACEAGIRRFSDAVRRCHQPRCVIVLMNFKTTFFGYCSSDAYQHAQQRSQQHRQIKNLRRLTLSFYIVIFVCMQ